MDETSEDQTGEPPCIFSMHFFPPASPILLVEISSDIWIIDNCLLSRNAAPAPDKRRSDGKVRDGDDRESTAETDDKLIDRYLMLSFFFCFH